MEAIYKFKDHSLLDRAMNHPSLLKFKGEVSYERLEFLGDKILNACMAQILFYNFPDAEEGVLSVMHANLVKTESLAFVANSIGLGSMIKMDKGELKAGGQTNRNNLEDALEAYIAAIFLDSKDYEQVFQVVKRLWEPLLLEDVIKKQDSKSALQEWSQKHHNKLPSYTILEKAGPEHAPTFTIQIEITPTLNAVASGNSRKDAERKAAELLMEKISNEQ